MLIISKIVLERRGLFKGPSKVSSQAFSVFIAFWGLGSCAVYFISSILHSSPHWFICSLSTIFIQVRYNFFHCVTFILEIVLLFSD